MGIRIKLTVLLFYITGFCISQNYNTRLFSKDQGLPDPYTYSTIQDKEGFLWISTGKGLVKFDGQFFSKVKVDSLGSDLIYSSALDKSGTLWFGSSSGKLFSTNSKNEKLKCFPKECKASVKTILASAFNNDLFVLTIGNGIFIKKNNELLQINNSADYEINALVELNQETLLAATSEGLFSIDLKSQVFTKNKNIEGNVKGIQKLNQRKNAFILFSSTGDFFEADFFSQEPQLKKIALFDKSGTREIKSAYYKETDRELFICTSDERLHTISLKTGKTLEINEEDFSATANSFFEDVEHTTWITTTGKGLYRLSKTKYDFAETSEEIFAIVKDQNKNLYYGTEKGILVYDTLGKNLRRIVSIGNKNLGKINALYFDKKNLWIGTDENGLLLIDPITLKESVQLEFSKIKNIAINSITGKGTDILVTTNLEGVYNYKAYMLQEHFSVENSLLHNNVYHSLLSKNGKTFYATHNTSFSYSIGKQLYEIDTKDLGLISDFNGFAEARDGEVFVATNGDGVYVMKDTTIRPFEFNEQLNSKFSDGVLGDRENNLWIIQRYHLYKYYIKDQVLNEIVFPKNKQVMLSAYYMDELGDLYFGTNKEVIHFKTSREKDKLPVPYLVALKVQDSLVNMSGEDHFSYGSYNFSFEFSALGLKNSEDILFRYMLVGRDEHWSELTRSRKAEFSKLGEGNYEFKVIAYNDEGFSSEGITLYRFTIAAPYWKKSSFWIAVVLALALLVFFIVKIRTDKLIAAKRKLEELVDEKTKQLREEKEIVEKSNIRIEEQNQEIRDSITYAKRIQDALLPGSELLNAVSETLFVLYQPRDIVSGDFYWIAEINGLKIIVAADCTGHGVPGALMSMIGTTLLNKIVLERKITEPKNILKELDKEIKEALKQHTEAATRDGMDMCLCCVDSKNKKLIYAGAMRPLFFVRNHQLIEHQPTKHAIGGFSYGKEKEFKQTEIPLQENDMFYLFSDGYADQFGGENGKKLMLKNFKKILISIAEMELPKQEENLKRVYNNWKGSLDQVDDVLVIGVRG